MRRRAPAWQKSSRRLAVHQAKLYVTRGPATRPAGACTSRRVAPEQPVWQRGALGSRGGVRHGGGLGNPSGSRGGCRKLPGPPRVVRVVDPGSEDQPVRVRLVSENTAIVAPSGRETSTSTAPPGC